MNVPHGSLVRYAKHFAQLKKTKCEAMVSARWLRCFISMSDLSDLCATPGHRILFLYFSFILPLMLLLFYCCFMSTVNILGHVGTIS